MNRDEAWSLVQSRIENRNLRKHMLAAEACLAALARRLGGDERTWGLAGLVHDIDYQETSDDPARHGLLAGELLTSADVAPEVAHAVMAHADNAPRESLLDRALYATDPLTGLIVSAALMHPDKRLASLDVPFVLRRFGEKKFSANVSRDQIRTCADLGLTLEEFVGICLGAMQAIAPELGL